MSNLHSPERPSASTLSGCQLSAVSRGAHTAQNGQKVYNSVLIRLKPRNSAVSSFFVIVFFVLCTKNPIAVDCRGSPKTLAFLGQNAVFNLPIDKVLLNMYNKGAAEINAEQNHINKFHVTKMKKRILTNYEVNINRLEGPNFPKG